MVMDVIGLYILQKISRMNQTVVDPNVTTDGMSDKDYTDTDLSDPENSFTDMEDKWWTIDTSREIIPVGIGGSCPVGYKRVNYSTGSSCLPILYNLENVDTHSTIEPDYIDPGLLPGGGTENPTPDGDTRYGEGRDPKYGL